MAGDAAGLDPAPDPAPKVNTPLLLLPVAPKPVAPPNWKPPENTAKMIKLMTRNIKFSQSPSLWDLFLNRQIERSVQFQTLARRGSR